MLHIVPFPAHNSRHKTIRFIFPFDIKKYFIFARECQKVSCLIVVAAIIVVNMEEIATYFAKINYYSTVIIAFLAI